MTEPKYVDYRKTDPSSGGWANVLEHLLSGHHCGDAFHAYLDLGANIAKGHRCIFTRRIASTARLPNVKAYGADNQLRTSIKAVLYLGATGRLVHLHPMPACGNRDCINPWHQIETRKNRDQKPIPVALLKSRGYREAWRLFPGSVGEHAIYQLPYIKEPLDTVASGRPISPISTAHELAAE